MKLSDEQLVSTLLTTKSNAEAARVLGISESQIYQKLRTKEVKCLLQHTQSNVLTQTSMYLTSKLQSAIETIVAVIEDPGQTVASRLSAAELLLKYAPKVSNYSWILASHGNGELFDIDGISASAVDWENLV